MVISNARKKKVCLPGKILKRSERGQVLLVNIWESCHAIFGLEMSISSKRRCLKKHRSSVVHTKLRTLLARKHAQLQDNLDTKDKWCSSQDCSTMTKRGWAENSTELQSPTPKIQNVSAYAKWHTSDKIVSVAFSFSLWKEILPRGGCSSTWDSAVAVDDQTKKIY